MIDEKQRRELAYNIAKKWLNVQISKMDKDPRWEAEKARTEGLIEYKRRVRWLEETAASFYHKIVDLTNNDEGWALMDEGDILNEVIRPSGLSADEFAQQKTEKARQTQFEPLLAQDAENRGWYGYDNMQMSDVADKLGYNWWNMKDRQDFIEELAKRQLFKDRDKILKEFDSDPATGILLPATMPNSTDFTRRAIMSGDGTRGDLRKSAATDFLRGLAMWYMPKVPGMGLFAGLPSAAADGLVDVASQAASNGLTDNPNGAGDIDWNRTVGTVAAAATLPATFMAFSGIAGKGDGTAKRFAEGLGKSIKNDSQYNILRSTGEALKDVKGAIERGSKSKNPFSNNLASNLAKGEGDKLQKISDLAYNPNARIPETEMPMWSQEGKKAAYQIWKKAGKKNPEKVVGEIWNSLSKHPEYVTREGAEYLESNFPGLTAELADIGGSAEKWGLRIGKGMQYGFGRVEPIAGGSGINLAPALTGNFGGVFSKRQLPDESKRRRWTIGLETEDEKNSEEYKNFIEMLKNR